MNSEIFTPSKDHFFGLMNDNGHFQFMVPKELMPKENDDEFFLLNQYIQILFNYIHSKENDENQFKDYDNVLNPLLGYLMLLADFKEYGDFAIFEHYYGNTGNKIHWGQTIKKTQLLVSDGQMIYGSFERKSRRRNDTEELYKLYKSALSDSLSMFMNFQREFTLERDYSIEEYKYHINKFKHEHFSERAQHIAKALSYIYLNNGFSAEDIAKFSVKYHTKFENIWEYLIHCILKTENINFKKSEYVDENGKKIADGFKLLPDHIIKTENETYIVADSKFYDIENGNFPRTADIAKQIMYRQVLKDIKQVEIERNIFICPQSKDNGQNYYLHSKHQFLDNPLYEIECWAFSTTFVIEKYFKQDKIYIKF